jgi:hypothetical protein
LDGKGIIELSFAVMLINDGGEKYPNNRDDPILGSVWPHSGPANYKFAVIFSFSSYTPRIMAGPTAITADLDARLTTNEREQSLGQSYDGRLWDVLFLASFAARRLGQADRGSFEISLFEAEAAPPHRTHRHTLYLWMVVGPGDQGEPVITIGFPEDF